MRIHFCYRPEAKTVESENTIQISAFVDRDVDARPTSKGREDARRRAAQLCAVIASAAVASLNNRGFEVDGIGVLDAIETQHDFENVYKATVKIADRQITEAVARAVADDVQQLASRAFEIGITRIWVGGGFTGEGGAR